MESVKNNSLVPAATSARIELSDLSVVRAVGLAMELDEARLVATCLSVVIASGRSKSREKVAQMNRGVVACCRVEGMRDGEQVLPTHPDLSEFGWPAGQTALRCLEIDNRILESYWARARTRSTDACLPLAWLLAFVPAPLWSAVLTVIKWGPEEAAMRLEDAVIDLAQRPLSTRNRRRPDNATLSAGTINTRITGVHHLFEALVKLRARTLTSRNSGLPVALLESWAFKPERPDVELCGATWARVDTSGPSFEEARGLLARVDANVAAAPRRSRYLRLRRRAVAALLLVHGQRVDALRMLDVADYLPAHNFGDGTTGAALVYRPGKTRAADEQHILALPHEAARWLEEWILYTGRQIGDPDSPMWPARKPKPGEPIWRLNASAFARSISGHQARDGSGATPLLVRTSNGEHGYNPHSYRHCAFQVMRRAGVEAKREQPDSYGHVGADDFARAVVGHDLIRSVGDVYRDLNQQHLARIAIEYAWNDLRAQPGLLGPDPARIIEVCARVELLAVTLGTLAADLGELEARQAAINGKQSALTGSELEIARLDSNTLVFKLARLQTELAMTRSRLDQARLELEQALQTDVSHDAGELGTYTVRLDEARRRGQSALAADALDPDDDLSVKELSVILDTTPKTINGWIRNGFPERRARLWDQGAWTHDGRGMIRTLPIRKLNQAALTPIQRERLLIARLRSTRTENRRAA
jgi:integrase